MTRRAPLVTYTFLTGLALLTVLPLVTILLASFKGEMEVIQGGGFALPTHWNLDNYVEAWVRGHFSVYFFNSILITTLVTALGQVFSVSCAYALTTLAVPFRRFWMFLLTLGIIVPEAAIIIPSYFNFRVLGIANTYAALVMPQVALSLAFGTFFLYPAFRAIPKDMAESAMIDGCSPGQILRLVFLPLLQPALSALSVFFVLGTWNDFIIPAILAGKEELRTLPIGLLNYQGRFTAHVTWIAAGTIIVAIPVITFYALFQRQLIRGISEGALKE